jgi:hypothetical protein
MARAQTKEELQRELYNRPRVPKPHEIGDIIEKDDGRRFRVVTIYPVMRPYLKRNQDSYAVGWTLGLAELSETHADT